MNYNAISAFGVLCTIGAFCASCENQKITNMDYNNISAIGVLCAIGAFCAILAFFALCIILFICFLAKSGYTSHRDDSNNTQV